MRKISYLLILCILLARPTFAQIGMGSQPHPSAVLDLKATDKGFYPPRLTTVQRKAITNAQPGMFVYDLDQSTFYLFDGANWLPLAFQNPASIMPTIRLASDGAADDNFGISVAISGNHAIVGAYGDDIGANGNQGSAYVFVRSGSSWTQQAKLTASDGAADDLFGYSVAISGDYAIVGAYGDDIGANSAQGSAYVFVRTGTSWTQQLKLTASDGAAGDRFGSRVAISGDYAIVGAYLDDIGANNDQGSAYLFMRSSNSWTQQAKLTASDGAAADNFGISVAISEDYTIVGAYADDIGANSNQGSAYVFVPVVGTWTQQAKLTASDGVAFDNFGGSVAISGDYAIVGAYNDDIGANTNQGSAYVFQRTGSSWTLVRKVTDNSPANTYNGTSVGISNGSFIIGGFGFESLKGKVSFGTVDN
jgi:FG-GAP repeat